MESLPCWSKSSSRSSKAYSTTPHLVMCIFEPAGKWSRIIFAAIFSPLITSSERLKLLLFLLYSGGRSLLSKGDAREPFFSLEGPGSPGMCSLTSWVSLSGTGVGSPPWAPAPMISFIIFFPGWEKLMGHPDFMAWRRKDLPYGHQWSPGESHWPLGSFL